MKIWSIDNSIEYSDTQEHFDNGLLRLLSMTPEEFKTWINFSSKVYRADLLDKLADGFQYIRPFPPVDSSLEVEKGPNGEEGQIWFSSIAESPDYGVATDKDRNIGWLVRKEGNKYVRVIDPPVYEEEYFEGDLKEAGGYGNYAAQESWRMEKARRQTKEMMTHINCSNPKILDIGSGYGYFRKALDELGARHYGLEISLYANAVSKKMYGFNTLPGTLEDWYVDFINAFDGIMLGDIIEHVPDPIDFLKKVKTILRPGGFVCIKTPNINCPEAEIFGPHYHSLKREHLVYFSMDSLISYAKKAGFVYYNNYPGTISHLLKGFVGEEKTQQWAAAHRGSDISIYLRG